MKLTKMKFILIFLCLHLIGCVFNEVIQRPGQTILRCYCTEEKCSKTNNICIIKYSSHSAQPSCYSKFTFDITEKIISVTHGCTKKSKVIKYASENASKKFKDKRKKNIRDNICTERTDKTNIDSKRSFDSREFMKNENNTEVSIKNQHRLCVFCCSEDFCNYITPEKNNMNPPNITTDTNKKTFIFSFNYNDIKSVDDKEKFNITPSKDKHLDTSSYNVLFLAGEQGESQHEAIILRSFFTSTHPSATPSATLFSMEDKTLKILTIVFVVLGLIIFAFLNYLACRILLLHEANCHVLNPCLFSPVYHQTNQQTSANNQQYISNVSSEIAKEGKNNCLNLSVGTNSRDSDGHYFSHPYNKVGVILKLPGFISQKTSKYYPLLPNQTTLTANICDQESP